MSKEICESLHIDSAQYFINIPLSKWTPMNSYLVCRALTDFGIIEGSAVIGTLRTKVFDSTDTQRPDSYSVVHSNYGWIVTATGKIMDPCNWVQFPDAKYAHISDPDGRYYDGIDPMAINASQLPVHYHSDEIYAIRRGLHKEVIGRILELKVEVPGLTMTEAAFIANLPLQALGCNAKIIYEFLIRCGLSRIIPIQSVRRIFPQMARDFAGSFYNKQ